MTHPSDASTITTRSVLQSPVVGDGSSVRTRWRARLRAWRWPAAGLAAIGLSVLVTAVLAPDVSGVRLAPNNPGPTGGQAVARVLEDQGVEVHHVTTVADAIALAGPGTTLLVARDYGMDEEVARSLVDTGASIALVAPGPTLLAAATDDVRHAGRSPNAAPVRAECTDADAVAAGTVSTVGAGFRETTEDERPEGAGGGGTGVLCFTTDAGASHYAVAPLTAGADIDGARPIVRALDEGTPITNAAVTAHGHAALALRMLGHEDTLVWLVPEAPVATVEEGGLACLLPPWAGAVFAQLVVLVVALALWRGRRLGPLVTEDMPVAVRASETTLGRGRLYRRARAYGHAGAALRAGTAHRIATRLGLPRSTAAPALIAAAASASHRPAEQVAAILYGPPPSGDVDLARLADELDHLESEVHRT